MELDSLIKNIHYTLQANEGNKITQKEMSQRLGISERAYADYFRGVNKPLGMKVLVELLSMLESDEIIKIIEKWKKD